MIQAEKIGIEWKKEPSDSKIESDHTTKHILPSTRIIASAIEARRQKGTRQSPKLEQCAKRLTEIIKVRGRD